jgi:hypothetical protein
MPGSAARAVLLEAFANAAVEQVDIGDFESPRSLMTKLSAQARLVEAGIPLILPALDDIALSVVQQRGTVGSAMTGMVVQAQ